MIPEINITFHRKLIIPKELKEMFPMTSDLEQIKLRRDEIVRKIIEGSDRRMLLIIGPCSADREDAVLDYMHRLAKLQEEVIDRIFIVPRLYTNKPRTTGKGYKGILHQPDPDKAPDLLKGIITVREMNIRIIRETGFTCADEILYPETYRFISDVLSYVAIGARSVEDQEHRLIASGIDIPVGMKNPTSGNLAVMMNSVTAAQSEQNFIYRNWEVSTKGNPLAHTILRGYENSFGRTYPNYHYEDLELVLKLYKERGLKNPSVIIDCNHANSGKQYLEQGRIAKDVIHSRTDSEGIKHLVKGLMIESYLEDGCQKDTEHCYGKSITDPCIGWDKTEMLVRRLAELWEM
ncbi:MAG: 3-deoxy-7-phosphoheptulonate synthase [Lachnospiraceae bacterium]|nr:3-deoxy-7-phosphoheptulonate synthase [Lachnospiraceae bacterium]